MRNSLVFVARLVEHPEPRADLDRSEQAHFGEGVSGSDFARRVQRSRLNDDEAAIHGVAVRLGEGIGKYERIAKALQVLDMLGTLRLTDGNAVRLIGAYYGVIIVRILKPASDRIEPKYSTVGAFLA